MSIKDIVNSNDWVEVENIIQDKMMKLLTDYEFGNKRSVEVGVEAIANYKSYHWLKNFLEELGFYKGEQKQPVRRDFR